MEEGINIVMEEKRCLLCNKPYNYKYVMFGRGCLDNIYEELGIHKPPRFVWNRELYLCTKVAWKNHKYFLSKTKKYDLTQKYIALNYLKNMNFDALKDIEEKMLKDIKNITPFSKDTYDFTDFKELREYTDEENGKMKDILSTTLNNLGVVSSEYGVIKVYDVEIKFETKEGDF